MSEPDNKLRSFWKDEAKLAWLTPEHRLKSFVGLVSVFIVGIASALVTKHFDENAVAQWSIGIGVSSLLAPMLIAIELYFRGREAGERLMAEREAARSEAHDYKTGYHAKSLELQRQQHERAEIEAAAAAVPKFIFEGAVYSFGGDTLLRIPFKNIGGAAIAPSLIPPPGTIRSAIKPSSRIERGQSGTFEFQGEKQERHIGPPFLPGARFSVKCRDEQEREQILKFKYLGTVHGFEADTDQ